MVKLARVVQPERLTPKTLHAGTLRPDESPEPLRYAKANPWRQTGMEKRRSGFPVRSGSIFDGGAI
mgnify:CR=1 FL=1|jgi:hypothetical protein